MRSGTRGSAKTLFVLAGVVALVFLLFPGGPAGRAWERLWAWAEGGATEEGTFWCPMDPQIVRPRMGICPICSMDLVPFEGGNQSGPVGVLQLSDRQTQQAGVRLGETAVRDLVREVDTTGRLEVDPRRKSIVTVGYPGPSTIETLHVFAAGEPIGERQIVAQVKNAQAEKLLMEYRAALKSYNALRRSNPSERTLADALTNLNRVRGMFDGYGLPDPYINILASKQKHIYADAIFPVIAFESGVALGPPTRIEGQQIPENGQLLTVADLDELWLYVDLFEHELPFVAVRAPVEFSTPAVPGETFRTRVQFIEPTMREGSQIVRARCRATNPTGKLAPGMSVRARLMSEVPAVLSVPESAVLQSGRRNVVIVSEGAGRFRPKIVELGRRHLSSRAASDDEAGFGAGDERFHEILGGLEDGDRVVVAGNFLLNAEAQFQGILKKMFEADDAQGRAPELEPEALAAAEQILDDYYAIARALTEDSAEPLPKLASTLALHTRERALRDLSPVFGRMSGAAEELARVTGESSPDLEQARLHFGTLSRELIGFLSEYVPTRFSAGDVFAFRCPMADDYGYDLWLQPDEQLANPYMGQRMLECGAPAELP